METTERDERVRVKKKHRHGSCASGKMHVAGETIHLLHSVLGIFTLYFVHSYSIALGPTHRSPIRPRVHLISDHSLTIRRIPADRFVKDDPQLMNGLAVERILRYGFMVVLVRLPQSLPFIPLPLTLIST